MSLSLPHRKRVVHFDEPGQAHELTFSCFRRMRLLDDPVHCALLSQAIDRATVRQGFGLVAFVYMPEHVHLIVLPVDPEARISRLLFAIKRPMSTRVKQRLAKVDPRLLERLTVRERPGVRRFRFWQEGGGYDRNLTSVSTLRAAVEYVHQNPVRRGLCRSAGDWRWSSWRCYHAPETLPDGGLPSVHGFDG